MALLLLVVILSILIKSTWKKIDWPRFVWVALIGSLIGYLWEIPHMFGDPNFPGWVAFPWTWTGIEFYGFSLEDILFYPISGCFFSLIIQILENGMQLGPKYTAIQTKQNNLFIAISSIIIMFYLVVSRSDSAIWSFVFLGAPGLAMMTIASDEWRTKLSKKIMNIVLGVCAGWDLLGVTIIPYICELVFNNPFWVYQNWAYKIGTIKPTIFNDTLWVFENPLDITYYFGHCGFLFVFGLNFFVKKLMRNEYYKLILSSFVACLLVSIVSIWKFYN